MRKRIEAGRTVRLLFVYELFGFFIRQHKIARIGFVSRLLQNRVSRRSGTGRNHIERFCRKVEAEFFGNALRLYFDDRFFIIGGIGEHEYVFIIFARRLNERQSVHIDFVRDGIRRFIIFMRRGCGFHIDAHEADRVRFIGRTVFVLPAACDDRLQHRLVVAESARRIVENGHRRISDTGVREQLSGLSRRQNFAAVFYKAMNESREIVGVVGIQKRPIFHTSNNNIKSIGAQQRYTIRLNIC